MSFSQQKGKLDKIIYKIVNMNIDRFMCYYCYCKRGSEMVPVNGTHMKLSLIRIIYETVKSQYFLHFIAWQLNKLHAHIQLYIHMHVDMCKNKYNVFCFLFKPCESLQFCGSCLLLIERKSISY